jgi:Ca2+-binding EF-hand superfamily protein
MVRGDRSVVRRVKDALIMAVVKRSNQLWQDVFKECDVDDDDTINRRELLVLMKRINLPIPSEEELTALIAESDVDENGELDYGEYTALIKSLGIRRTADVVTTYRGGLRQAVRSYLQEKRRVVLWRDVFNRLDRFPRDGQIDAYELQQAFGQIQDGPAMDLQKIRRLLMKYDSDGDGMISFEEFKAKATDVISSGIQYERAAKMRSSDWQQKKADAARRAELANAQNAPLDASSLPEVEARLQTAFSASGTFDEALGVLRVQDDLYRKFKIKYGAVLKDKYGQEIDDTLNAERVMLLDAIVAGDLDGIRATTQMDWNFVYPPAYIDPESGERQLEAWCRTPLCLLVRPDEGNFDSKLRGISEADRQALLQDVLSSGCADPNFPLVYWSNPAVHASFEGDVEALETLRANGCNLRQKFEWVLQEEPLFSLVHAAAFNGQEKVLRYLREYYPPSFFRELDATGSNALHVTLESSRDMSTATFLLKQKVDGFAMNDARRSPLSMAIEVLPELARTLLEMKSRFEYRWWGNDLFWFSFDGIILPLQDNERPVELTDLSGEPTTIEQLIIKNKRKELLETPLMLDLIERKWTNFASELYFTRILKFSSMLVSVFVASIVEPGSLEFYVATAAVFATWAVNLESQVSKSFQLSDLVYSASRSAVSAADREELQIDRQEVNFQSLLDYFHLAVVPGLTALRLAEGLQAIDMTTELGSAVAFGTGLLQVTLALRLLTYVSLFRVLGPLLVTVVSMLFDGARFGGVLLIVIFGYANGFYSLIHSSMRAAELEPLSFDYSYGGILSEMLLWLSGQPDLAMIRELDDKTQLGADILFWTYLATAYYVLLNLLIAIFNSTYERIISNSISEWLYVRLTTLLEFENDYQGSEGVLKYYEELKARDGQRAVSSSIAGMDKDGDGKISPEEYRQALGQ